MFLSVHVFSITCANIPKIGIKSPVELTRVAGQSSADSQKDGADTGLAAGTCDRRLARSVARRPATRQVPAPPGGHSPPGRSDGRITRSARTLVQRQLPIRGYGHILNLASPRGCHAIASALTAARTIRMRGTFPAPCGQDVALAHRAVERGTPGEVVLIVDDDLAAALEV
jgi:hypothetical protein